MLQRTVVKKPSVSYEEESYNLKTLEEIREYFSHDKYATQATGAEILEASEGYARVRLVINEKHINGAGYVMGGVYFTLADFASAVALNQEFDDKLYCALTGNIDYISSVQDGVLYAEARILKEGRKITFSEVNITDEDGKLIARTNLSSYKVMERKQ